ncbi:putative nuclease HARBI1 isoform X2 [Scylla paramamosain]
MELLWALEYDRLRTERVFRDRLDPLDVSDAHLLRDYRLPRHEILQLCEELGLKLSRPTNRTSSIPVHTQVMLALRFFASGSFQSVLGDTAGLSQASTSRVLNDVTSALFQKARIEIKMPASQQDITHNKQEFCAVAGFPSVIGVVDCTHVPIRGPRNGHTYLNKKKKYSLNVQVVTDGKMRIISFNARFPGSMCNSYVWRESQLRKQFTDGRFGDSVLLGDSSFPLEPFLMTPVRRPKTTGEHAYNISHEETCTVMEQTLGTLKSRFRCLHESGGTLKYNPVKCAYITVACMYLHNICVEKGVPLNGPLLDSDGFEDATYRGGVQSGLARRRAIIEKAFS